MCLVINWLMIQYSLNKKGTFYVASLRLLLGNDFLEFILFEFLLFRSETKRKCKTNSFIKEELH